MMNCVSLITIALWLQLKLASVTAQGFVPNVPEECKRLGYCDIPVPDYPEEHIEKLIAELGLENQSPSVTDVTKPTRRNNDPQEVELCSSRPGTITPRVAQDESGNWNFVFNSNTTFRQEFLVEICKNKGAHCSSVVHFNTGYSASCQQNFISKKMIALDETGAKIEKLLKLPSNCYCQVKQDL